MKQCYFCNQKLSRATADGDSIRYVCQKHPMWIWHYYRRGEDNWAGELSKVYFPIQRANGTFGFSLRLLPDTLVIEFWPTDYEGGKTKEVLRLRQIPDNLTPENAAEKLSFYLTYY